MGVSPVGVVSVGGEEGVVGVTVSALSVCSCSFSKFLPSLRSCRVSGDS